jgi:hypothetical protein
MASRPSSSSSSSSWTTAAGFEAGLASSSASSSSSSPSTIMSAKEAKPPPPPRLFLPPFGAGRTGTRSSSSASEPAAAGVASPLLGASVSLFVYWQVSNQTRGRDRVARECERAHQKSSSSAGLRLPAFFPFGAMLDRASSLSFYAMRLSVGRAACMRGGEMCAIGRVEENCPLRVVEAYRRAGQLCIHSDACPASGARCSPRRATSSDSDPRRPSFVPSSSVAAPPAP